MLPLHLLLSTREIVRFENQIETESTHFWLVCKFFYNGCLWEIVLLKFSQKFWSKVQLKNVPIDNQFTV